MTTTSRLSRWRGNLRRLPGRTPLRVKMITALLALVVLALAVISVASLTVFRNYLQGPGRDRRSRICTTRVLDLQAGHGLSSGVTSLAPTDRRSWRAQSLTGRLHSRPASPAGPSLPNVPTTEAGSRPTAVS